MNPNNKFNRCATKFLTIIIVLSIMGCGVGVPTKASVNIVRSQDLKIDDDDIISMAPRRLLEKITKKIEKTYTNIELVDGFKFRDTAFPEGKWRLKKLLEPQVRRQVNAQLNIDYLALVGSIEDSQGEAKGFMIPPVLTVGSGEIVSTITALIIDLKSGKLVSNIVCDARGTMYLFHYVIFVTGSEPQTDSGAAEGLAIEIGKVITELTQLGKVRLAVLAVEDFEISYDIDDWRSANLSHNKLALDILEERAREGEQDAQWFLYQVQPNAENMTWLCRDADQGMARACSELGKLYYYGSDEYRKSMGVHVPADISRSCMWFHLAGLAKITEQTEMNDVDSKSALYESAEVERTANAMTAQELAKAEQLLMGLRGNVWVNSDRE